MVPPIEYNKSLLENITKTYKKSNQKRVSSFNIETKKIAEKFSIDDRIEKLKEVQAYVAIKDHKEKFPHLKSFRLINPSKSEIGKISKKILDKINSNMRIATKVNQWKNTKDVINWFNYIKHKQNFTFITFDVESFYPSISCDLFKKAISFAKHHAEITDQEVNIVMQARKTFLFYDDIPWTKKECMDDFDIPMGCFNGAECCELVGSYILNLLGEVTYKDNIGLYRDDGLGIFEKLSGPQIERNKKQIIKVFKDCGLKITVSANQKSIDFLDVTFHLDRELYQPYRKPNTDIKYIHKNSNHPPTIINQLPKSIAARLSETSSNRDIFIKSKTIYENALRDSGFSTQLEYSQPNKNQEKKTKEIERGILSGLIPHSLKT